jgi:hypothetical protein
MKFRGPQALNDTLGSGLMNSPLEVILVSSRVLRHSPRRTQSAMGTEFLLETQSSCPSIGNGLLQLDQISRFGSFP